MHSTASDGVYSPAELVQMAVDRRLTSMAITDHDTVAGVEIALQASEKVPLELIPGVEISAVLDSREVHLLGYLIDLQTPRLREVLAMLRASRLERVEKIISRLNQLGSNISVDQLVRSVGESDVIGRPHVAQALVDEGFVSSVTDAFDRYLSPRSPAYVPRYRMSPTEAISLIREAKGVPVLAHPLQVTELVPILVEEGLAGLEVFYKGYTPGQISELRSLARRFDLISTGGTDFHGRDERDSFGLGGVYVPPDTVSALRQRWEQDLLFRR